ncbi:hypothetical protein BH11ACT3_BH11ACT3_13800 [soil metagenome]
MGFLDRLFGTDTLDEPAPARRADAGRSSATAPDADERAIARYRYLLQTAPPETIEQVHAEAFAKLSDEQRARIYEELSKGAGTGERPLSSEPATLARAATRAELRNPGSMERSLAGPSFGSMVGSSLLGTVGGYVIGSALVSAFLPWGDTGAGASADAGADASGADAAASDSGSMDAGADMGGFDDFGGFDGF